jgi:pimeloyl-ACP methyl ester carboxylesterase
MALPPHRLSLIDSAVVWSASDAILRAPITSIHGSRDWLTPRRSSKGWLGRSSAGVTYHSIPRAGHLNLMYRAGPLRQTHAIILESLQENS